MTLERTIETPYRTNVRPAEIRASSRNVLIASGISVLLVAGFVGGAVALANARKEKQRLEQQLQQHEGDSAHIISGPDFEGTDRVE